MATSTETFSKEVVTDLDIIPIYKDLMKASTGTGSVFLRAKETLKDLFDSSGGLTGAEKGQAIASTISAIATNITSTAMQTALALAKENRDAGYVLAKLREDTILVQENQNKIASDIENAEEDLKGRVYAGWKAQGELVRDFGINAYNLAPTTDIVPLAQYSTTGLKYEAERLAKANVYNTYASSYRGNGYVVVPTNADGSLASNVVGDNNGLVTAQTGVAIRQREGFDDNMRQHVANSSSSMISMLLSTEAAGIDYTPYLDRWNTSVDYLNVNKNKTAGSITNNVITGSKSVAAGFAHSGTTVNILAGSSIEVQVTDGTNFGAVAVAIVQIDGTWSVTVAPSKLTGLTLGTCSLTATVTDETGTSRTDIDTVTLIA